MRKTTILFRFLLTATIIIFAACTTQSSIHGLWQDTKEAGTIEFKTNGEVIIVDNMSATVTGSFELKENDSITFELTATDIMRDSIQPTTKTIVTAKIIKFDNDELQLSFSGNTGVEHYKRIR